VEFRHHLDAFNAAMRRDDHNAATPHYNQVEAALEAYAKELHWFWLSFCDSDKPKGQRFLGVAIVRGSNVVNAIQEAHRLDINPGGEVLAFPVSKEDAEKRIPSDCCNRLLRRDELVARNLWAPSRGA
jgi:hypothetical protein